MKGTSRGWQVANKKKKTTATTKTTFLPCFFWSGTVQDKTWIRSMEAKWRRRLARNKRKRTEKKETGEKCSSRVKTRKIQKKGSKREIALQKKFYQMWRQTEREKEKSHQSRISLEKKSSDDCSKGVVPIKTLLDIPGEILNLDCRIQMLPWEKESLAK